MDRLQNAAGNDIVARLSSHLAPRCTDDVVWLPVL